MPRALVAALLLGLAATSAHAQSDAARLIGVVTDVSGGALPGVTVTASGAAASPASVVTDDTGRYISPALPPGVYIVTFELAGFESRRLTGVSVGRGQTVVLDQQLALAALSETVEVRAPIPPPPPQPLPPAQPRPKAKPVEPEILASVCGPRLPPTFSLTVGRVVSDRDAERQLLGPGDLLRIDAGTKQGLSDGQNLVVRRRFDRVEGLGERKQPSIGEQTAGLVQIIAAQPASSTAIVVYACSEITAGDSIEKYVPQPAFYAVSPGTPRFEDPARIIFGEYGRSAAAKGDMMVMDHGIMQGVQRGQRVTIFRRPMPDAPPVSIGDGVVIAIRADSATIKIDRSTDAISVGDLVAIHR